MDRNLNAAQNDWQFQTTYFNCLAEYICVCCNQFVPRDMITKQLSSHDLNLYGDSIQ